MIRPLHKNRACSRNHHGYHRPGASSRRTVWATWASTSLSVRARVATGKQICPWHPRRQEKPSGSIIPMCQAALGFVVVAAQHDFAAYIPTGAASGVRAFCFATFRAGAQSDRFQPVVGPTRSCTCLRYFLYWKHGTPSMTRLSPSRIPFRHHRVRLTPRSSVNTPAPGFSRQWGPPQSATRRGHRDSAAGKKTDSAAAERTVRLHRCQLLWLSRAWRFSRMVDHCISIRWARAVPIIRAPSTCERVRIRPVFRPRPRAGARRSGTARPLCHWPSPPPVPMADRG